jgi:hypothetical protein
MNFILIAAILLLIIGLFFFMGDNHLKTEEATPGEVQGTYILLLHGCRHPDDLENVAILDKEGDPYSFEIFAKDSAYTIKTGLTGEQALKEAEQFIRCSVYFERTGLRKILGPGGAGIGFEVRPIYSPARFGANEVIDMQYTIKDRKVTVHIKIDPEVLKALRH